MSGKCVAARWMIAACLAAAWAGLSWAQEAEKPDGEQPEAAAPAKSGVKKSSVAEKDKPDKEKTDAAKSDRSKKTDSEAPALPDDPAVSAILAAKSLTPAECVRAARILSDLNRSDLARQYLQKVLDAKLDAAAMTKLAGEIGSATFVRLSTRVELQPQARQLADAVLAAQNAVLQNPQHLAELIKQLQDPSFDKRSAAFSGLMETRGAAVSAMIDVLADSAREAEQPAIRTALAAMGRQAIDPLLEILDRADAALKVQAMAVLSELKAPSLQLYLFQPYFSEKSDAKVRSAARAALEKISRTLPAKAQAVRSLAENAKNYFSRRQIVPGIVDGKIEVWHWNEANRQCTSEQISADAATRALTLRFARYAYEIAPDDSSVVQLYLAAMLDAAAHQNGLSKPLDDNDKSVIEAKKLGAKAIDGCLAYSISNIHPAAAAAAARILGQIGKPEELLYVGPKPGALAAALQNPDRRLRFAAAKAIAALKPQRPFAGSGSLVPTLAYYASTSGMRRVLLAGADVADLRKMTPALSAAGFQVDTAVTGREALLAAVSSPDYELAMIDAGMDQPPINLLLQQLHHDDRTADLRVDVIAREGFLDRAERAAAGDALSKAFPHPRDDAAVTWQLEQLGALKPDSFVAFDERQSEAVESLDLLAELGKSSGKLFDIRQAEKAVLNALYIPALSRKAIAVLALMNSPAVQRALVDTAGGSAQPLEIRQAAVSAFRENVQSHGILLTADEIKKQYQLYNDNKNRDAASQKIIALILDCLEARK
jgi:hypothetical protein